MNNSLKEQEVSLLTRGSLYGDGYFYINGIIREKRSDLIWNLYNPHDLIQKGTKQVIHHKNRIRTDDRIENLQKLSHSDHARLHNEGSNNYFYGKFGEKHPVGGRKHTPEERRLISTGLKNKPKTVSHRQKLSIANTGKKQSTETVAKRVASIKRLHASGYVNPLIGRKLSTEHKEKMSKALKGKQAGEKHHFAKTTESEVLKLRACFATGLYTLSELAVQFGMTYCMVEQITSRKSWRHL